jgi:hypothetical protein
VPGKYAAFITGYLDEQYQRQLEPGHDQYRLNGHNNLFLHAGIRSMCQRGYDGYNDQFAAYAILRCDRPPMPGKYASCITRCFNKWR